MPSVPNFRIAATIAGLAALVSVALTSAGAQGQSVTIQTADKLETAIFAGGCFWCVESDLDKVDGVLETISGYTGGTSLNPTYANHEAGGHIEAVQVTYDSTKVSYEELVEYFMRHIDPVDAGGQFCDRGPSYTTAIFAVNETQAEIARSEIAEINQAGILPAPVVTRVLRAGPFHAAEDYHQDYYIKAPLKYGFYRQACGRDARVNELWGATPTG